MLNWNNKKVILVNKDTNKEVKIGDAVTCFRGEKTWVTSITPPHKSNSAGFVNNFYAHVFNCKFVEL